MEGRKNEGRERAGEVHVEEDPTFFTPQMDSLPFPLKERHEQYLDCSIRPSSSMPPMISPKEGIETLRERRPPQKSEQKMEGPSKIVAGSGGCLMRPRFDTELRGLANPCLSLHSR